MLLKEPPSYLPAVNKVAMTASYFTTGENKSKQSPFWKCIDFMHNSDMCHLTTILVPWESCAAKIVSTLRKKGTKTVPLGY